MLFDPRWRFPCLLRRPLIKTSIYYINFSSNSAFGGKRPYLKEALDYTRLRTIGARALVSVETYMPKPERKMWEGARQWRIQDIKYDQT